MDTGRSPKWIGFAHRSNEFSNFSRDPWPAQAAGPAFPGPKQADALTMPCDDSLGFDDHECRAPIGPEAREPNPEKSIERIQSGSEQNVSGC
jgi:hypothetical protein